MMARVTKELENGTWNIEGIDWKEVPRSLYGALCKLRDYEQTGLNPKDVEQLASISEQLFPIESVIEQGFAHCPKCHKLFGKVEHLKEDFFCEKCGQHIQFFKERWLEENADKSE